MSAVIDHGTTRDGVVQLRRRWKPTDPARAAVLLVHGMNEHSGRYDHVGAAFASAGFDVIAFDLRGFGESGGRRGHVDRFSDYLDDVEDQLTEVRGLGLSTAILAHSMGGLIALRYCLDGRPLPDQLVLSSPALGYEMSSKERVFSVLVPVLRRAVPTMEIREPGDPSLLAVDPAVGEAAYADPLRVNYPTVSLGAALVDALSETLDGLDRLTVPTLCFHGGDDQLVPTESSAVLESVAGVERHVLDGLRHEIFQEPSGLEIVDRIIAWLEPRLV